LYVPGILLNVAGVTTGTVDSEVLLLPAIADKKTCPEENFRAGPGLLRTAVKQLILTMSPQPVTR